MSHTDETAQRRTFSRAIFWLGMAGLLVSVAAAGILAAQQLDFVNAPGCGDDSPCAAATSSRWGKIPGLDWPLSFVGVAYFAALFAAWVVAQRSSVPGVFKHAVRAGAGVSVLLIAVMIFGGYLCPYCLAVHLGNLVFLSAVEVTPRGGSLRGGLVWAAAAFGFVSAVEAGLLVAARGQVEEQLRESTERIIAGGESTAGGSGFSGRYRMGPEAAPIRLVIISDYQCPDCRRIEQQVRVLLSQRTDLSFSAKHSPLCMDCNPYVRRNMHPNACWAARAAEAAGILGGDEAFFRMHNWLFDHKGQFTNPELAAGLTEMGFDVKEFTDVMRGPETLARVQADIEEAHGFGIHFTPMIFVNGVELKGWQAPQALTRGIESVAATNPPALTATADRPSDAAQKYIDDWSFAFARVLPSDPSAWRRGRADAPAQVIIWGDYQEPNTAGADKCMREILAQRDDVTYSFRHYPFNAECNPDTQNTKHPLACLAHRAAEAAGVMGGEAAYWAMHDWLMDNQSSLGGGGLTAAAQELGLDADVLTAVMASPEVTEGITRDTHAATLIRLRSLPMIYVNGKLIPRWRLEGRCMLPQIIDMAADPGFVP